MAPTLTTNSQAGNPRAGKKFQTKTVNGKTVHVYKGLPDVVVKGKGLVAKKAKSNAAKRSQAVKFTGKATMNNVKGNPRAGSSYKTGTRNDGTVVHRYAAEAGGIPQEDFVLPKKRSTPTTSKG